MAFLLKEEKKREDAVLTPANPKLSKNTKALKKAEFAEAVEGIPENKEELV